MKIFCLSTLEFNVELDKLKTFNNSKPKEELRNHFYNYLSETGISYEQIGDLRVGWICKEITFLLKNKMITEL